MSNPTFRKTPLATGVALALGATMAAPVGAQDEPIEEIVVTGIRGSLMQATDIKRQSQGVVDAISAEDIGKFPDTNLAESLQRITGVSIDRSRGEGSKVTVRGFGPQFNLVTLNGRQMPTQTGKSSEGTRSFDFANLASEGIAAVEVYKTSRADIPTGGIGATINVKTTKPLETDTQALSFGLKFVNDTSTDSGDDFTPEISGIFIDHFADDTLGISLSAVYQERDNGLEAATVNGWNPTTADVQCCDWGAGNAVWGAVPADANQVNRPPVGSGDLLAIPQQLQYRRTEYNRERFNGQLTLQWDATETLRATLDYTYAELDLAEKFNDYSAWFSWGNSVQASEWTADGAINAPVAYSESPLWFQFDTPAGAGQVATKNQNDSVGINLDWRPTDRLAVTFDYHDSTATVEPNSALGSEMSLAITTGRRVTTNSYWDSDLPILDVVLDNNNAPLSAEEFLIGGSVFTNQWNDMNVEQAKLEVDFELNDIASINFGIQTTDVENRSARTTVQRDTWGGVGSPGDIADLLTPTSMAGWYDEIDGAGDPRRIQTLFTFDANELIARAREMEAAGTTVTTFTTFPGSCGDGFCPSFDPSQGNFVTDLRTQEEQLAGWVQLDLDLTWGNMPVNLDIGVRYEDTNVASQSQVPIIDRIDWVTDVEFPIRAARDGNDRALTDFVVGGGGYTNLLPNLDFNIEFIENVLFRASYSETIARPGYVQIQGGIVPAAACRADGCNASEGVPDLDPLESENFDVSFEWYYAEGSYAAAGYFYKDVKNFIASRSTPGVVLYPDVTAPNRGGLAALAEAALGSQDAALVRNYIFDNFGDDPSVDTVDRVISSDARNDVTLWDITRPINNDSATVDGFELALQHTFGDSGFGFVANATFVDANVGVDFNSLAPQFALAGLSDSANFIGFYDKNGIQARVAYNWRDKFLSGFGHDIGNNEPRFIEKFGQWDMNASYDFGDRYTVFVEGINITNETFREHARHPNMLLQAQQTGPRWAIGFRGKF